MENLINSVKESEATLKIWRNKHTSTAWKNASKVNAYLTGIPLNKARGCECVEDLFFLLKRQNSNQIIKIEMNRKFKLKPGKVIMLHGCTPITDKATDKELMKLLELSPAHIAHFETYPDDWREICGLKPIEPKKLLTEADSLADLNGEKRPDQDDNYNDQDEDSQDEDDSTDEDNAQDDADEDNSNDGDSPQNEERKNELLEMKNDDLKKILIEMKQELPVKANKANLIDAILGAGAKQ